MRVHSGRDPITEADRFVEAALGAIPGGAPSVVVLIGPGLGYAIEGIERRAPGTRVIAIEPFPAMARAMLERRDWSEAIAAKRLVLLVGPDYRGAAEVGRTIDERAAAATTIIEHPVYKRECASEVMAAAAVANRVLEGARLNAEARRHFAGRYLLNTLKNLPALLSEADVDALRDAFAGLPAIVVAAGPSLDRALPHLRELQDRAVIVAVDTTLPPLRAAGIRPHLVVAVDPSEANARHLLALEETGGSWLVTEGSIDPRVYPRFAGRVFTFKVSDHQPWPWLAARGVTRGTLRAWGSVLTTAFDLALFMGCEPVVFAGADLSFPGGIHYCRGTMNEAPENHDAAAATRAEGFAAALKQKQATTCETTDIGGQPIHSTPQFLQFRDWLVSRAVEAAPRQVINATGSGILYGDAIEQASLDTLRLPSRTLDVAARLAAAWGGSLPARQAATEQVVAALTRSGEPEVPRAAWTEFTMDSAWAHRVFEYVDARWRTPAAIVRQPASVVRPVSAVATLSVEVAGGPPPALQWQASDDGQAWRDLPGANAAAYSFTVDASQAGRLFRVTAMNRYGTATSDVAAVTRDAGAVVYDVDGDGCADILWRDPRTGANEIWYVAQGRRTGVGTLVAVPDQEWRLAGAGRLGGPSSFDVLWRHTNGSLTLWHLAGIDRTGWTVAEPLDPAWVFVGTGGFSGRDAHDWLWWHPVNGAVMLWLMDGVTRVGDAALPREPDPAWMAVAIGDFNGDGRPDVVWRNRMTGENRVWIFDGVNRTQVVSLEAEADPGWQIIGVGAFQRTGASDLAWRHATTAAVRVWEMQGVERVRTITLEMTADVEVRVSAEERQRQAAER